MGYLWVILLSSNAAVEEMFSGQKVVLLFWGGYQGEYTNRTISYTCEKKMDQVSSN